MTHSHDTSTPAMSAETVPSEEFVLVPREPTEAMIDAADRIRPLPPHYLSEAYRAMIAAAPVPNPSPAAKGGEAVREAAQAVINSATNTYRKRNGQRGTIEGDDGEMAWIVPFDPFEELRAALSTPTEGPASQTEGMGGDALHRVAAMARGYELMQRAIWNMAGTSGAEASWYRNTALAITGRVDPLWKVEKLSNCSRPGDCLTQADKFVAALAPPETAEAVPVAASEEPIGWQLYLQPLARWGRHINTKATADEAVAGFPASSVPIARPLYAHPAPATDDRERLVAIIELFVSRIERNGSWDDGCFYFNGRAASELERPLKMARAALATEASR